MTRRTFLHYTVAGIGAMAAGQVKAAGKPVYPVRVGGNIFKEFHTPDEWIAVVKEFGYTAAYCPVDAKASDAEVAAYREAAKKADIPISEVGAWSNPISPIDADSKAAIEKCKVQLDLADRVGAGCCVNISGSRNPEVWDGPHPDNVSDDTFDLIVQTTREIIDAVKPKNTFYSLEMMPWVLPDSPDEYLRLIKAIDRDRFAVHLDPVNIINSPRRYYRNGAIIRECFEKLGPWIKNCHAKDIFLRDDLTTRLDEVLPGTGGLDYAEFIRQVSYLKDVPMMIEHLQTEDEYRKSLAFIRKKGAECQIEMM